MQINFNAVPAQNKVLPSGRPSSEVHSRVNDKSVASMFYKSQTALAEYRGRITVLQKRINELEAQHKNGGESTQDTVGQAARTADADIDGLRRKIAALETALEESNDANRKLKRDLDAANALNESLRDKIKTRKRKAKRQSDDPEGDVEQGAVASEGDGL